MLLCYAYLPVVQSGMLGSAPVDTSPPNEPLPLLPLLLLDIGVTPVACSSVTLPPKICMRLRRCPSIGTESCLMPRYLAFSVAVMSANLLMKACRGHTHKINKERIHKA
jgi:hypothetical protein